MASANFASPIAPSLGDKLVDIHLSEPQTRDCTKGEGTNKLLVDFGRHESHRIIGENPCIDSTSDIPDNISEYSDSSLASSLGGALIKDNLDTTSHPFDDARKACIAQSPTSQVSHEVENPEVVSNGSISLFSDITHDNETNSRTIDWVHQTNRQNSFSPVDNNSPTIIHGNRLEVDKETDTAQKPGKAPEKRFVAYVESDSGSSTQRQDRNQPTRRSTTPLYRPQTPISNASKSPPKSPQAPNYVLVSSLEQSPDEQSDGWEDLSQSYVSSNGGGSEGHFEAAERQHTLHRPNLSARTRRENREVPRPRVSFKPRAPSGPPPENPFISRYQNGGSYRDYSYPHAYQGVANEAVPGGSPYGTGFPTNYPSAFFNTYPSAFPNSYQYQPYGYYDIGYAQPVYNPYGGYSYHSQPPPPPSYNMGASPYNPEQMQGSGAAPENKQQRKAQGGLEPGFPSPYEAEKSLVMRYKPPVSWDSPANDLSFQLSLRSAPESQTKPLQSTILDVTSESRVRDVSLPMAWSKRSCVLQCGGVTEQSRPFAIEHYADGLGQDKITMICPNGPSFLSKQPARMKWLHLRKPALCLEDLVDIVVTCPSIDPDYATLALRLLQTECPKYEKKFSNGKRIGYYIEPGTVIRYDGRYSDDIIRGEKSVTFFSAPYLNLEEPRKSSEDLGTDGERLHRTRTLLESLYDFDLMNERDKKQVIRRNAAADENSIICVPQVWYLLCGSVLISCGQMTLSELRGDSIQEKYRSNKNIISHVTDLDNHQFTVALKTTDSYFTIIRIIERLRSNLGGGPINNYNIELKGGEFLTPKTWLEIVKQDPLPSLELTLKPRQTTSSPDSSTSLVLAVIPKTNNYMNSASTTHSETPLNDRGYDQELSRAQDSDGEHENSDNNSGLSDSYSNALGFSSSNGHELMSLRTPNTYQPSISNQIPGQKLLGYNGNDDHTSATTTYPLNSFTGALVKRDEYLKSNRRDRRNSEDTNDLSEKTLINSLATFPGDYQDRISALNSNGLVVNDPTSLSMAPDILKLGNLGSQAAKTENEFETPYVFDYLVSEGDGFEPADDNGPRDQETTPISFEACGRQDTEDFIKCEPDKSESVGAPQPKEEQQSKDEDDSRSIPFLQWKMSGVVDSDDVVRRVLDQISERLRHSEGFKKYQKIPDYSLEQLHETLSLSTSNNEAHPVNDRILSYRKKQLLNLKPKIYASVKTLVEMFIPINFEHDVTKKIWGGIQSIWQYMDNIDVSKHQARGSGYHIQGYEKDKELWEAMGMEAPTRPFENCQGCSRGFSTSNEGVTHLRTVHFNSGYVYAHDSTEDTLGLYLRTPDQIQIEARINILTSLTQHIDSIFTSLHERSKQLQLGARKPETPDGENGYPVMGKLVRAFEKVTLLITIMASEVSRVSRLMKQNTKRVQDSQRLLARPRRSLDQVNTEVQKHLENAKIDMIITSRTDSLSDGVTLSSIGPEFMIAVMSSGLFLRPLHNSTGGAIDTCEVYKNYTTSLQFQVNQRPQRRAFADMYALEEELDILRRVNRWQRKFCNDLLRVLDPASYKMTTKGRITHFRLESPYVMRTLARLEARDMELAALQSRTRNLREQLKQSIEIREESHGKAIRVFTVVTAFFLPLSFVTSFMGMNTTDIRDTNDDQTIFWIVALPTTAVVLGLAFIYGYKWDAWKEEFVHWRKTRPRRQVVTTTQEPGPLSGLASRVFDAPHWRGVRQVDVESGGVKRQETDLTNFSYPLNEKRVRFWGLGKAE
ncbi:hypothetical protein F4810DRAFT_31898 [Camillea tinctor]|nr:hypothetical protein F4810DRAFT_31898 [Camillea tinctor]